MEMPQAMSQKPKFEFGRMQQQWLTSQEREQSARCLFGVRRANPSFAASSSSSGVWEGGGDEILIRLGKILY